MSRLLVSSVSRVSLIVSCRSISLFLHVLSIVSLLASTRPSIHHELFPFAMLYLVSLSLRRDTKYCIVVLLPLIANSPCFNARAFTPPSTRGTCEPYPAFYFILLARRLVVLRTHYLLFPFHAPSAVLQYPLPPSLSTDLLCGSLRATQLTPLSAGLSVFYCSSFHFVLISLSCLFCLSTSLAESRADISPLLCTLLMYFVLRQVLSVALILLPSTRHSLPLSSSSCLTLAEIFRKPKKTNRTAKP